MTYAELIRELQDLDPDRLQDTVTVYVSGVEGDFCAVDEFYSVNKFQIAVDDVNDTLDDGHAYLEI